MVFGYGNASINVVVFVVVVVVWTFFEFNFDMLEKVVAANFVFFRQLQKNDFKKLGLARGRETWV